MSLKKSEEEIYSNPMRHKQIKLDKPTFLLLPLQRQWNFKETKIFMAISRTFENVQKCFKTDDGLPLNQKLLNVLFDSNAARKQL